MGKYRMKAITLALFVFLEIPPTIIPRESVDISVSSQLPKKAGKEPCIVTFQNSFATNASISKDAKEYSI